jgi:hypothetical protein
MKFVTVVRFTFEEFCFSFPVELTRNFRALFFIFSCFSFPLYFPTFLPFSIICLGSYCITAFLFPLYLRRKCLTAGDDQSIFIAILMTHINIFINQKTYYGPHTINHLMASGNYTYRII